MTSAIRWTRAGLVIAVATETVLLAFAVHPGQTHQLGILLREMGALVTPELGVCQAPACPLSSRHSSCCPAAPGRHRNW